MILKAVATIFLLIGIILSYRQYTNILGKEVAVGEVTALEPYSGSKGSTTYKLVAKFRDRSGQVYTYRSSFSASSTGYDVGDRIRIWFAPDNPNDCGVLSFGYGFGFAWILIVIGLAIWLAHLGWGTGNSWLEERFPTTVPAVQSLSTDS